MPTTKIASPNRWIRRRRNQETERQAKGHRNEPSTAKGVQTNPSINREHVDEPLVPLRPPLPSIIAQMNTKNANTEVGSAPDAAKSSHIPLPSLLQGQF